MKRSKKILIQKGKGQIASKKEQKNKAENNSLFIIGAVAALVLFFVFNYFSPDKSLLIINDLPKWLSFFFNIVIAVSIFVIIGLYKEERSKKIASSIFLILILINIVRSLIPLVDLTISQTDYLLKFEMIRSIFYVPTFVFGVISIWLFRDEINEVIDRDVKKTEKEQSKAELKRGFFSKLKYKVKKEGTIYIVGLVLVTGISGTILLYQLDNFDFWSDEKQVTQAAAGYYHTGTFQQWDFIKEKPYPDAKFERNYPHLWLVAQSYNLFGVSEWSSRIISALAGILFIVLGYFVLNYFFKNKAVSLLILLAFSFHPEEIVLFRWTRMYGILIPFFLLQFTIIYKGLTGTNKINFGRNKFSDFINKYLNFDYYYIIPFIGLVFLGYFIHKSSVFTLPAIYLTIIYLAFTEKETKYYSAIILGFISVIATVLIIPDYIPTHVMTFFEKSNYIYLDLINFFPFSKEFNLTIFAIGLSLLFVVKNKDIKNNIAYFYIFTIFILLMFIYIIAYVYSFRYVSFLTPISIFLSLYVFLLISRAVFNRYIFILLSSLMILSAAMHLYNRYDDLYVENFASSSVPSKAYTEIVKNYKKGEAVFYQFPIHYYFKGIDTSAVFIDMRHNRLFKFNKYKNKKNEVRPGFVDYLNEYKAGWVLWDTQNAGHIDSLIYSYVNYNFKKIHGFGIDDTNVEVFRYTKDMIIPLDSFKQIVAIPSGNLKMSNAYSFTCWIKLPQTKVDVPFLFVGDTLNKIIKFEETDNGLRIRYAKEGANAFVETNNIRDDNWHLFAFYQQSDQKGSEYGIYIDGRKIDSKNIPFERDELVKFKVNTRFRGGLNEIRIYDYVLSENQILSVYNNGVATAKNKLIADDRYFEPIYFWTRK